MGLQSYHQHKLGLQYFMGVMEKREVFTHEIEVLASKTLQGYKWRSEKVMMSIKSKAFF